MPKENTGSTVCRQSGLEQLSEHQVRLASNDQDSERCNKVQNWVPGQIRIGIPGVEAISG